MCFRGRPHISEVKKNGGGRGKLANKFTPCSITVFLFIFYPFLPLRPRETGYQLSNEIIRQQRQTRKEQQVVRDVDDEIDQNLDLQPQENDNSSDVEQFADEDEEGDDEGSDDETPDAHDANTGALTRNAVQWSSTLK